jgi:glyoxylase-like metal-dependent hydrolase (beta-lactamase superfamily II)
LKQKLPYQLTDNIYALGHDLFLTYLIKGNPCVLLDLGISGTVPLIRDHLQELGVDAREIGFLVVLHAHWDHVCGLPYLKQLFPWAKVLGSAKALEILSKEKIVAQFRQNDEQYCSLYKEMQIIKELPNFLKYDTITVDKAIEDEEIISFGGLNIQFIATPGHSPCTLTAYLPAEKVSIISDAVCYLPKTDEVIPLVFQSPNMTLASIEKLQSLETNMVAHCHDTELIVCGPENVSRSYRRMKEEITKFSAAIKQMAASNRTEEEMLAAIFQTIYKGFLREMYPTPDYLQGVSPLLLKAIMKE